ncbi:MAG: family 78 glycoside hydrolase catalytic domain [Verrucomicrobiota bacterium]
MKKLITATLLVLLPAAAAQAAPVHLADEAPVEIRTVAPGVFLVDFGRVAFGNLRLTPPAGMNQGVTIHFGEALAQGRINRKPPGSVRYSATKIVLVGAKPLVVAPLADARNMQQPAAVLTPPEWGVVTPFRWVEIEGWSGDLTSKQLRRQAAFASSWDDQAAAFTCSDEMLNRIWELCRYSIKAMTFAGVYVDGDRERIPYEADAYINQLSHYATDYDIQMARDTYDRLMKYPTPKGPVLVTFKTAPEFTLSVQIPTGMTAVLSLPLPATAMAGRTSLVCNGKPLPASAKSDRLVADQPVGPGRYEIKLVTR